MARPESDERLGATAEDDEMLYDLDRTDAHSYWAAGVLAALAVGLVVVMAVASA